MVQKLLKNLGYQNAQTINLKDEQTFKEVVIWLEINKIQGAPPDLLNLLNKLDSKDWFKNYQNYTKHMGCPVGLNNDETLQWLSRYAIQKQFINNKYDLAHKNTQEVKTQVLDQLDFTSNEFIEGVNKIAKLLSITPHPEVTVTLRAIKELVTKRLNQQAIQNPQSCIIKGIPFLFGNSDFETHATKVLRLLFIQDLRDFQTNANEIIVAIQNVTANPKTDTRLGKVGV